MAGSSGTRPTPSIRVRWCLIQKQNPFQQSGLFSSIGLAQNNNGFCQLNQFLSQYSEEGKELPERAPVLPDTFIIYPFSYKLEQPLKDLEFIGIRPEEVTKIYSSPVRYALNKAVILQPVTFATKGEYKLLSVPEKDRRKTHDTYNNYNDDYELHCLLQAIDQNVVLSRLNKTHIALANHCFVPQEKLEQAFALYPGIIQNTKRLLDSCSIQFDLKNPKNKKTLLKARKKIFGYWKSLQRRVFSSDTKTPLKRLFSVLTGNLK